jgi:hypothetical protein
MLTPSGIAAQSVTPAAVEQNAGFDRGVVRPGMKTYRAAGGNPAYGQALAWRLAVTASSP